VKHLAYDLKKNDSKTISLESMLGFRSKLLDPSDNLLDKETKEWVRRAVSELPDIYRSVVMLYYFDGKSAKEAAKLQGISIATFLSRLHRARKYLYALLAGLGEDTLK
jgi:RNA polymerase sigma-70 factor (ECF subfamily)